MRNKITVLYIVLVLMAMEGTIAQSISWLPIDKSQASVNKKLQSFLDNPEWGFRVLSCQYQEASLTELELMEPSRKNRDVGNFEYAMATHKVNGDSDAIDLDIRILLKGGEKRDMGVALAFDFFDWNSNSYVMIPGAVYNGNRNRIVNRAYAMGLDRSELYQKDLPLTTAAIPQLSPNDNELSRLEVNTSNTTTPAICVYDRANKMGFIVLAEQGIAFGEEIIDHGFIVEESHDRKKASLVINAPGVREKKPEFIGFSKSPDRGITWKAGEERKFRFRLYKFFAADMGAFMDKFMRVRKTVTGPNSPRNLIPMSEVSRLMCANIDKRYYQGEDHQFYCPENANWISFGWIGGMMNTFPMLALGDEMHRNRVKNTFDFGLKYGQGESGYFYGALYHDGKVFGREGYDEFPEIVLTRKNADVLYWMVKQFMLLQAQGHEKEINLDWEKSVKALSDAFVSTWKKYGQWGNFVNNKTGEIAVYNTTSGVMAIGGLALASQYYENDNYMEVAKQAADHYYNYFLKWGMTTGGCADILQNADSETAAAFMTSLMTMYEVTGDEQWLYKSHDLANLSASWTVSFDYQLPGDTPLAKLGAKLTGAVWASTQNKHGAPGFCTLSGDSLFKIYRAMQDKRYASLMRDIIHAHAEGIQPNGFITERLTYCDADSRGSRGDGGKTGWNETNGALMAMEIPGIYVRTDLEEVFVFDHVKASITKKDKSGLTLQITNPTSYDAHVTVLAEDSLKAKEPLGVTGFLGWSKVSVKAGQSISWKINY